MKKLLTALLLLTLCMGSARAEAVPDAHAFCDVSALERYAGFAQEEATGEWQVCANETKALLDYLPGAAGQLGEYAVYYFTFGGNRSTGAVWTELNIAYRHGSKQINAISASFRVDGVRHDLVLKPKEEPNFGAETYAVRLGMEGVALLDALAGAEKVSLQIIGDYPFTASFEAQAKDTPKNNVVNYVLRGAVSARDIASLLQLAECGLWDESAGNGGAVLRSEEVAEAGEALSPYLGKADRLCVRDKGNGVKAYQGLLREQGYYPGKLDGTFGAALRQATLQVQQYAGLLPTGCADRQTLEFLLNGQAADAAPAATPAPDAQAVSGEADAQPGIRYRAEMPRCAAQIDRHWRAPKLSATNAKDMLATRECADSGHTLLIAEGWIRNEEAEELLLGDQLSATFQCGGTAWEATLLVEQSGGTRLGTVLGARDAGRLLIFAEVPSDVASEGPDGLQLRMGENVLNYALAD